jgi:hypothetical protein
MMQICRYVFIVMLIVLIGKIVGLCTGGGAGEAVEICFWFCCHPWQFKAVCKFGQKYLKTRRDREVRHASYMR